MLCPLIKLTYIGAIFPIFGLIYCKFKLRLVINNISVLGSLLIFLVIKKFYTKLCFLFPFQFTCIQTKWSLTTEQVLFYLDQTKSCKRYKIESKYNDFDHTIYSFDWFLPWFKDYFVNDAF